MKSRSIQILIIMIVCNLAALTGYYFLFQYIVNQTQNSSSLLETINLGEQKNSRLGLLRTVADETETERQQINGYFISNDTEISFIEEIENLAKNSGLVGQTLDVASNAGPVATVNIFNLQIQTVGSWSNTMYFLNQLEKLPYDLYISGISIDKDSGTKDKASDGWSATFDIGVFERT